MSIGKMDKTITIFDARPTIDADGFAVNSISDFSCSDLALTDCVILQCRAYAEPRSSTKRWSNLAAFSTANMLFRLRYPFDKQIEPKHKILYKGKIYNILSVENVRERNMYLEILAENIEPTKNDRAARTHGIKSLQ